MTINRFIPLHNDQYGAIPTASGMYDGELAVNLADGKLYTKSGSHIIALNDYTNFVSSSGQIVTLLIGTDVQLNSLTAQTSISASIFTGSFKGDGSQLTGLVTDLRISGSTGNDVLALKIDDLTITGNNGIEVAVTDNTVTVDVPVGLSASLYGTASVADGIDIIFAGIYETGSEGIIIPAPSGGYTYISTASYAYTASYIANNTWNNLLNIPEGIVSSSAQVYYYLVQNAISSSYATTASYAMNGGGGGGSGTSGTSGTSGANGGNGTSGTSGISGINGTSGISGTNGTSGATGSSGTSGNAGSSGTSGIAGTSGTSGVNGTSGSSGQNGSSGSSGTSGESGTAGTSGTSGLTGTSGTAGSAGSSGISGELPAGVVSSSQQVLDYNIFATTGSNNFVGNQTVTGSFTVSGSSTFTNIGPTILSGAVFFEGGSSLTGNVANLELFAAPNGEIILQQGFEFLKVSSQKVMATNIEATSVTGSFSGSLTGTSSWANNATTAVNVEYLNVLNKPSLVSSSIQIVSALPSGTVSSSTQVENYNIFATTGSNIFKANQTITGSLYITNELVVLGSSSIQYVSQSTLNIGTNLITVNAQNPSVRFGGLAVIDSASSPRVSGSLLFDSVENQWLYVHQGTTTTSSILIMGPETYNNIGNETHPTTNRIMKSINDEHIGDSQITDDGTTVSIPGNLLVTGHITASTLTVSGSERITGSLAVTGSFLVNGQVVQALTSSYLYQLADVNDYVSSSITDGYQLAWNSGSQQWTPTAGAAAKGVTRLFISANRSNTAAFYFNAIQITADSSANTSQDTAFMLTSNLVSKVNIYLRSDTNTTASLQLYKNADGAPFTTPPTASSLYPTGLTGSLAANTVRQFTFSNLTINNYDTLHIYCKPTANGYFYGIVTIE